MSPVNMERGKALCHGKSDVHECSNMKDALHRVDIIATAQHDVPNHCINLKVGKLDTC